MPRESISRSIGSFRRGYSQRDLYRTTFGGVGIDYKNTGNDKGTVYVVAIRENDNKTLIDEAFRINFAA